ncbi:MAG TPA: 3-oxoacyl-ACP reductase FabG [Burkholderiales bacterium]|nr:3-oxoacyl-ACP reductase FabG [Burkholderiales bacterium]
MKKALVSGGSGALGEAISRTLARDGLHVVVHAHAHPARAERIVETIRAEGGSAEAICFDVRDHQVCGDALEALVERIGPIQVIVNNAGIHDDVPLAGMSEAQWHNVVSVSLDGFFNVTRPLLLHMLSTRWGRIVNLSSVSGLIGNRGQVNYAAAKAGLHGATKALALEVASRGVTVNAVAPGVIASPGTDAAVSDAAVRSMVPMKRRGTPGEVAALIGFLASDQAGYITGQIISVSGGLA